MPVYELPGSESLTSKDDDLMTPLSAQRHVMACNPDPDPDVVQWFAEPLRGLCLFHFSKVQLIRNADFESLHRIRKHWLGRR